MRRFIVAFWNIGIVAGIICLLSVSNVLYGVLADRFITPELWQLSVPARLVIAVGVFSVLSVLVLLVFRFTKKNGH